MLIGHIGSRLDSTPENVPPHTHLRITSWQQQPYGHDVFCAFFQVHDDVLCNDSACVRHVRLRVLQQL